VTREGDFLFVLGGSFSRGESGDSVQFRCKRRNSSSITAGVDGGSAVVVQNGDDDAMGVGQDEIYLEGNEEIEDVGCGRWIHYY